MLVTTVGVKLSGGSAWLDAPAAAAYQRMLAAGCPSGGITDAGRTYLEQVAMYARFLAGLLTATAARPGTSKHESGRALDLAGGAQAWVRAHGAAFGWMKDRVPGEPWHMEYEAAHDTHDTPTTTQEDDVLNDADKTWIHDEMLRIVRAEVGPLVMAAAVVPETGDLRATVLGTRRAADEIRAAVKSLAPSAGAPVDVDALAEAVVSKLAQRFAQ